MYGRGGQQLRRGNHVMDDGGSSLRERKATPNSGAGTPRTHEKTPNGSGGNTQNALIVFVKNADPGRVKTRLAADLGDARTMEVYMRLVAHTMQQAMGARPETNIAETNIAETDVAVADVAVADIGVADVFVYFSREIPDAWPDVTRDGLPVSESGMEVFRGANLRVQKGGDLGQRMKQAFQEVFSGGYDRAVIIGSDCPELDASHLEQAFRALATHDTVAGPASDGGYYLLGMRTLHPEVFDNKAWSTDTVLHSTLQDFKRAGLNTCLLPELRDMDDQEDYRQLKHLLAHPAPPGNSRRLREQAAERKTEKDVTPLISIIIPVYNEEEGLGPFLRELGKLLGPHPPEKNGAPDTAPDTPAGKERNQEPVPYEIIIVDGGSTDRTVAVANESGVRCVLSPRKGRAAQMNYGAGLVSGEILYFLHADTIPPSGALSKIIAATETGVRSGCFRLSFDEPSRLMRFYAWFTRFDLLPFRYGDQSLFVSADLFHRLGGYREDHVVMEDNDFFRRIRKQGSFVVLKDHVVTSARKYRENGFVRLQLIFTLIFMMYYLGFRQETLVSVYRRMIVQPKL
ncbi:MAG: DUF2064 domain-containing protein [Balneolaceae bacterium]|nr:MAG: DUF2064 domain-containing protein [Balneolaceae bacterium]